MKKILGAAVLALTFVVGLHAYDYTTFKQLTIDATAGGIGFTATDIQAGNGHVQATQASCRAETAEMRYTIDGTTVTSSVGMLLEVGDVVIISGTQYLLNLRAIRTTSTSGGLSCTIVG